MAEMKKFKRMKKMGSITKSVPDDWQDVQEWIATHVENIDRLYDQYMDTHEWSERESNLYNRADVALGEAVEQTRIYAEFLRENTMGKSTKKSSVRKDMESDYATMREILNLMHQLSEPTREAITTRIDDVGPVRNSGQLFGILDAVCSDLSEFYSASAKKSKARMQKRIEPRRCSTYLDIPVCPECGSPNLQRLGRNTSGNEVWICTRCLTPCYTDDSFDMSLGQENRFTESTKKSKIKKYSHLLRGLKDTLENIEGTNEEMDLESALSKKPANDFASLVEAVDLATEYYEEQESDYEASTKKSKMQKTVPKNTISFEDSVNKIRKSNYSKTGNLNSIIKERK